jgi:hypothetical protein
MLAHLGIQPSVALEDPTPKLLFLDNLWTCAQMAPLSTSAICSALLKYGRLWETDFNAARFSALFEPRLASGLGSVDFAFSIASPMPPTLRKARSHHSSSGFAAKRSTAPSQLDPTPIES